MPLLIPGNETTTYRGHWNVWGVDGWFDFREPTLEMVQAEMRRAAATGGTVSVNHPKPWGPEWEYGEMEGAHAIEVWNGPWERLNALSVVEWEERLLRGERLVAVGGSDTHVIRVDPGTGPLRRPRPRAASPPAPTPASARGSRTNRRYPRRSSARGMSSFRCRE